MKKLIFTIAMIFVLCFGLLCTTAQAAPQIKVTVDGKAITFTDAKPFVDSNYRTQVPMRALGEALKCDVDYLLQGKYNSPAIELSKRTLSGLQVKTQFYPEEGDWTQYYTEIEGCNWNDSIDGPFIDTGLPIINGRSYLPARYVAELFGYTVEWDEENQTVIVKTDPDSYFLTTQNTITAQDLIDKWQTIMWDNENTVIEFKAGNQLNLGTNFESIQYSCKQTNKNLMTLSSQWTDEYGSIDVEHNVILLDQNTALLCMTYMDGSRIHKLTRYN